MFDVLQHSGMDQHLNVFAFQATVAAAATLLLLLLLLLKLLL
jgi:hypothetical protein